VYSLAELRTLTEAARKFGLRVQMDGARFANAIATLGVSPAEMTWRAGVDVLSFGGTKNGIAVGEAGTSTQAAHSERSGAAATHQTNASV
jgi:threonine aldolase